MGWLVVLTGVCGSGKSTIGRTLAEREKAVFIEGDDFHSPENVAKMKRGQPLTDEDRQQWLETLHRELSLLAADSPGRRVSGVLACSALKRSYRDILLGRQRREGERGLSGVCVLVQLTASEAVLQARVAERLGHFMPASLVSSQLALLEPFTPQEWPSLISHTHHTPTDTVTTIQHFIESLTPQK